MRKSREVVLNPFRFCMKKVVNFNVVVVVVVYEEEDKFD